MSQSSTAMAEDELGPLSEPSYSFPLACDGDFRTGYDSFVMGVIMNLGVDQRNPDPLENLWGEKNFRSLSSKVTGDGQDHSSLDTSLRHLLEEVFCSTNLQSGAEVYTSVNSSLRDLACDF